MKHGNSQTGKLPIFRERLRIIQGDMSITAFAEKLELSRQTVGFYLNGDRIPDALTLRDIAEHCNVSVDYLLGFTADPERRKATADDLCLSAKGLKNLRYLASCSSDDRPYSKIASMALESDIFTNLIYHLYLCCQVNIAELIYNNTWPDNYNFNSPNPEMIEKRNNMILQIAESKKYNSVVSAYLKQMVRMDKENDILTDNDDFPLDINFTRTIIPETVHKQATEAFSALKHELCNTTSRPVNKQLEEEMKNGHN